MNERRADVLFESRNEDQEIDLIDILDFLRTNFVTLAVCLLLGIAGGAAIFSALPYKWQADVTLQIGKVPVLGSFDYIDPPAEVVEKIKSPLFLSRMVPLMYGNDVAPNSPTAALLYQDLKVSVVQGSNLVTAHVFGWTAEQAYKNAGLLADSIIAEHRSMSEPYLLDTKKRLAEVTADIARNREVLGKVESIEQSAASRSDANTLLRLALIDAKTSEIQHLQAERTRIESLLSAEHLQETRIVGRSLVPRKPSSPKRGLLIVGGAFFGLLFGLLVAFGLTLRRRCLHRALDS